MADKPAGPVSAGTVAAYLLYKAFAFFVGLLPRGLALAWGMSVGWIAYHLDARHRAIAQANLFQAFGTALRPAQRSRIALRSYMNFVRTLFDGLKTASWSQARLMTLFDVEGGEHLDRAAGAGRGVLLFTAHFGNWEMIIPPIADRMTFLIIARALDNPLIDRDVERARERRGATIIDKFGAGRRVLRALARKEAVGILIDQNVLRREAVFVDFFGKSAATTPALAYFHLRTGAPIVPMYCFPSTGNRYRFRFEPPVEVVLSGREEEDVLKITSVCTKMIEDVIGRHPELWLWVHKRWQSRPLNEKS